MSSLNMDKSTIHIGIVVSRFNEFITKRLLAACLDELRQGGLGTSHITTVWVPGALEIPLTVLRLAQKKKIHAVIALGAVIRGQTYHFHVVANECARGLMEVGLKTAKPVIMGVLTTDTISQAQERSREKGPDNKGRACAKTALEMVLLLKKL